MKENISFEEFSKVEMKIGRIIKAEKIEGSNKLIKLEVEFGNEKRIIVAGILQHYEPSSLEGKEYVFVTNLEKRKIFGVLSEGMILAAEKNGELTLIMPEREIEEGARVR